MRTRCIPVIAVVVLIAGVLAVLALAKAPSYKPPVNYTAGSNPYPVAVADFNDDGRLDVATGNEDDNNVSILLGKGSKGKFKEQGNYPAGAYPYGVAAGKFVGDGKVDLAVADNLSDSISLLRGNGNGGFALPTSVPVPAGPVSVATADLNGDKVPDLAVASESDPAMSVLIGKKQGGFKAAESFPIGGGADPTSVAIGQIDGKGGLDVAILDDEIGVRIFRGNGKGDFKAPVKIAVPDLGSAYGFALGQLDGMGRTDIWISRCQLNSPDASVLLLAKGDKGLKYKAPDFRPSGYCAHEPEITDVDGNGYKDAVVPSNNGKVTVVFNRKKGLSKPKAYPAGARIYSVATGDFNGDGVRDFAAPDIDNAATAIVLSK